MKNYEKLGAFYLGRRYDAATRIAAPEPILYDSRDLTTHGVCVGMTGSGKTGLCLTLLEEAAIDGIPVIAIDPKGDLGNLLLAFPELKPEDFEPWVDQTEALRRGQSRSEYASGVAAQWRQGLAEWDQDPERIGRLRAAAEFTLYTPGSRAGTPLGVLRSLASPREPLLRDPEALGERIQAAASGLLAALGLEADPLQSPAHILLSNVLRHRWSEGRDLDLPQIIRDIQTPPFERVGVFEVESFLPAPERRALAMRLNNLLASPGFEAWTAGEPMEIERLLWTSEGRPRVAVLSIAHLPDEQRMLFVTLLLNEVVAWMRTQPGTGSLRALVYMDEVFGYLPPTANPPAKLPLLTLLKQARAFGVGCLLATQNPVDLDYKALSNAGTWFIGRLQTERDRDRVLDGLERASAAPRGGFDRQRIEGVLSSLGSRVFLMNNVHEDEPVVFQTRWALCYLAGPLTRAQIERLTVGRRPQEAAAAATEPPRVLPLAGGPSSSVPPPLPPGMTSGFLPAAALGTDVGQVVYRPALLGQAHLHYVSAADGVDRWEAVCLRGHLEEGGGGDPWVRAEALHSAPALENQPLPGAGFASLPAGASTAEAPRLWERRLKEHLLRSHGLRLWSCRSLKLRSHPGESEGEFRARVAQAAREQRDLEMERLRQSYAPRLLQMEDRLRSARQSMEREQSQHSEQKLQTAVSLGSTLLGALLGRRRAGVGTLSRAASTVRGVGRIAREKGDVERARQREEELTRRRAELETEFETAAAEVRDRFALEALPFEERTIHPRKSDITIDGVTLAWIPGGREGGGPPRGESALPGNLATPDA